MNQKYCIDTSLFINAWKKHYPPHVFPSFWTQLDELIRKRVMFSCEAVYDELQHQKDELFEWAKKHKRMFQSPSEDVTHEMAYLMSQYPNFAAQGGAGNAADPWVIAHARRANAIVVTDEQFADRQRDTKPPKIPNVCTELDMTCMSPVEFLAANDISF